jgi:hypothetical protein
MDQILLFQFSLHMVAVTEDPTSVRPVTRVVQAVAVHRQAALGVQQAHRVKDLQAEAAQRPMELRMLEEVVAVQVDQVPRQLTHLLQVPAE